MTTNLHPSCLKATLLIERQAYKPLTAGERAGLFMHLRICKACAAYQRHSKRIDQLIAQRDENTSPVDASRLEQAVLKRISE
jgi:hypothetical protein